MELCYESESFEIDAKYYGNLIRFIDHGCDTNCWFVQRGVDVKEQIWVLTVREIGKGEDLSIDYLMVAMPPFFQEWCLPLWCI